MPILTISELQPVVFNSEKLKELKEQMDHPYVFKDNFLFSTNKEDGLIILNENKTTNTNVYYGKNETVVFDHNILIRDLSLIAEAIETGLFILNALTQFAPKGESQTFVLGKNIAYEMTAKEKLLAQNNYIREKHK